MPQEYWQDWAERRGLDAATSEVWDDGGREGKPLHGMIKGSCLSPEARTGRLHRAGKRLCPGETQRGDILGSMTHHCWSEDHT